MIGPDVDPGSVFRLRQAAVVDPSPSEAAGTLSLADGNGVFMCARAGTEGCPGAAVVGPRGQDRVWAL